MSIKYYDWAKFQANTRPNKIAIRELDTKELYVIDVELKLLRKRLEEIELVI